MGPGGGEGGASSWTSQEEVQDEGSEVGYRILNHNIFQYLYLNICSLFLQ